MRRNIRSTKVDWSVPLPDFKQHWTTLVGDDILFPGHTTVSSFLKSATADTAPSANFLSAKNIFFPCPPSLSKALHPLNPDRQVWLDYYNEGKGGLENMDVYERINKKQYLLLRCKGLIPTAILSMCVMVVKPDRDGKPDRAKSRIVVLRNFKDKLYAKAQRYAPVLKYDSLRLLTSTAVSHRRVLQQGDCKNAFYQATLPDDEKMAIRPPVGDPAYAKDEFWLLNKTLYGLRRSPHHWYNKFTSILRSLGLTASPNDPCLYTGVVNSLNPPAQSSTSDSSPLSSRAQVQVGCYVDDFVFWSADPAEEKLFQDALAAQCKVEFIGDVDFFLGTAFSWKRHDDGNISVHFSQAAFIEHTAH